MQWRQWPIALRRQRTWASCFNQKSHWLPPLEAEISVLSSNLSLKRLSFPTEFKAENYPKFHRFLADDWEGRLIVLAEGSTGMDWVIFSRRCCRPCWAACVGPRLPSASASAFVTWNLNRAGCSCLATSNVLEWILNALRATWDRS